MEERVAEVDVGHCGDGSGSDAHRACRGGAGGGGEGKIVCISYGLFLNQ